jgi:hypothetical protein
MTDTIGYEQSLVRHESVVLCYVGKSLFIRDISQSTGHRKTVWYNEPCETEAEMKIRSLNGCASHLKKTQNRTQQTNDQDDGRNYSQAAECH